MSKSTIEIVLVLFSLIVVISCSEENVNSSQVADVSPFSFDGATLSFTPTTSGSGPSNLPVDGQGSWFSMNVGQSPTVVAITSMNGLILGSSQGVDLISSPDGDIDAPWLFFGSIGAHKTVNDISLLSSTTEGATINFSGWGVTWNGIPFIDLSKGAWNGVVPDSVATLVCDGVCEDGSQYTLTYSATVPVMDPSGYGGAQYFLHLEGVIASPPS